MFMSLCLEDDHTEKRITVNNVRLLRILVLIAIQQISPRPCFVYFVVMTNTK